MKKQKKGLTLVEVVVSIAIYGVLAMMLTEIMLLVNATMQATNQLNKRLAYESKYADNLQPTDSKGRPFATNAGVNVLIHYTPSTGEVVIGDDEAINVTEYTAHYYPHSFEDVADTDGANYRFMRFSRGGGTIPTVPDRPFTINMTVNKNTADGDLTTLKWSCTYAGTTYSDTVTFNPSLNTENFPIAIDLDYENVNNAIRQAGVTSVPIQISIEVRKKYSNNVIGEQLRYTSQLTLYPAMKVGERITFFTDTNMTFNDAPNGTDATLTFDAT